MSDRIILASNSKIRQQILRRAGIEFDVHRVSLDEVAVRQALLAEKAKPRDMADTLAEMKAHIASTRWPGRVTLGCDQVLEFKGEAIGKAANLGKLQSQLMELQGESHMLHSAIVAVKDGQPIWRFMGKATLHMRQMSDEWIADYLRRNGLSLTESVGGYKIEEEGIRLFDRVDGDFFTIQGLPIVPLITWLTDYGILSK
ncbi:MAG: Maf family protein [Mangrovicoccus sp.]